MGSRDRVDCSQTRTRYVDPLSINQIGKSRGLNASRKTRTAHPANDSTFISLASSSGNARSSGLIAHFKANGRGRSMSFWFNKMQPHCAAHDSINFQILWDSSRKFQRPHGTPLSDWCYVRGWRLILPLGVAPILALPRIGQRQAIEAPGGGRQWFMNHGRTVLPLSIGSLQHSESRRCVARYSGGFSFNSATPPGAVSNTPE